MRWRKYDGYHERHQYIAEDGRIAGEVGGSEFQKSDGWTAHDRRKSAWVFIGAYETLTQAKAAVELAMKRKAKDEKPTLVRRRG